MGAIVLLTVSVVESLDVDATWTKMVWSRSPRERSGGVETPLASWKRIGSRVKSWSATLKENLE